MDMLQTWLLPNFFTGILFLILGGIAIFIAFKDYSKFDKMKKTKAEVVDFKKIAKYNTTFPIVSFTLPDGKKVTSELNYINEKLRKGDFLNIYYNANNPEEILSKSTMAFSKNIGLILILIGIIILITNLIIK